ncbi:MAG: hypothetical protein K940chlam3_00561 [Chlamydiae bacterium]|nr:hypothetical protein [Chlamydiota bacterium]
MINSEHVKIVMGGVVQPENIFIDLKNISQERDNPKKGIERVNKLPTLFHTLRVGSDTYGSRDLFEKIQCIQGVINRAADYYYVYLNSRGKNVDLKSKNILKPDRTATEVMLSLLGNRALILDIDRNPTLCLDNYIIPIINDLKGIQQNIGEKLTYVYQPEPYECFDRPRTLHEKSKYPKRDAQPSHELPGVLCSEFGLEKLEKPKGMDEDTFNQYKKICVETLPEMLDTMLRIQDIFASRPEWVKKS